METLESEMLKARIDFDELLYVICNPFRTNLFGSCGQRSSAHPDSDESTSQTGKVVVRFEK